MKFAPQWMAASIDIVPSVIACASGSFEVVKLPEQRKRKAKAAGKLADDH